MTKPKRERRRKSISSNEKHEPVEVEVRFSVSKLPPPPFIVTRETVEPARKADGPEPPPIVFRL